MIDEINLIAIVFSLSGIFWMAVHSYLGHKAEKKGWWWWYVIASWNPFSYKEKRQQDKLIAEVLKGVKD